MASPVAEYAFAEKAPAYGLEGPTVGESSPPRMGFSGFIFYKRGYHTIMPISLNDPLEYRLSAEVIATFASVSRGFAPNSSAAAEFSSTSTAYPIAS
jgi:hypothetical protein